MASNTKGELVKSKGDIKVKLRSKNVVLEMGTTDLKTIHLLSPHPSAVKKAMRGVRDMHPLGGRGQFLFAGTNILKKKISRWEGWGKNFLLMPQNAS